MKIIVEGIHKSDQSKLSNGGWAKYRDPEKFSGPESGIKADDYEHICGVDMAKEFESFGDAIRDFEGITKHDVIAATDQCGCSIYEFRCLETKECCSGWQCGKYLFENWEETPRKTLKKLNEVLKKSER